MDLVYFSILLLVAGASHLLSEQRVEETGVMTLPDFSLQAIEFEISFDLPDHFVKFARPKAPKLALSENMESVMVEVRSALLVTSEPIEMRDEPQIAAVLE